MGILKVANKEVLKHLTRSSWLWRTWSIWEDLIKKEELAWNSSPEVFLEKVFWKYAAKYRKKPIPRRDFKNVALQLYWIHTLASVSSCKTVALFHIPAVWEPRLSEISPYKRILLKNQNLFIENRFSRLTGISLS